MAYQLDEYDECLTDDPANVIQIAADLWSRGHVVTTWADGDGSKFDLLWSFDATRIGRSSMIDAGPGKLFVGVVGNGCFGFNVSSGFLAPTYIREKLNVGAGVTSERLATLIMAVRTQLCHWVAKHETEARFLQPG